MLYFKDFGIIEKPSGTDPKEIIVSEGCDFAIDVSATPLIIKKSDIKNITWIIRFFLLIIYRNSLFL